MKTESKPKRGKLAISIAVLAALIAVTFFVIFKDHSLADIIETVKSVNPLYIGLGVLVMVGYMAFQAGALYIPMKSLGVNASYGDCAYIACAGFYFSAITPSSSGGQPMQLFYMRKRGMPMAGASLSLILANIAYQIVIMLFGLLMLILRFHFISGTVRAMTALIIFGYTVNFVVLTALLFIMFSKGFAKKAVNWIIGVGAKLRLIKDKQKALDSAATQLQDYAEGAAVIKNQPSLFIKVIGATFGQMACYFLVPFLIYKAFGLSGYSVFDLVALQSILYIAVSYVPLPGSVGASEKGFVTLFTTFFTSGLVVPAMLLSRGLTFYLPLIVCGLVTVVLQLQKPKIQQLSPKRNLKNPLSKTLKQVS